MLKTDTSDTKRLAPILHPITRYIFTHLGPETVHTRSGIPPLSWAICILAPDSLCSRVICSPPRPITGEGEHFDTRPKIKIREKNKIFGWRGRVKIRRKKRKQKLRVGNYDLSNTGREMEKKRKKQMDKKEKLEIKQTKGKQKTRQKRDKLFDCSPLKWERGGCMGLCHLRYPIRNLYYWGWHVQADQRKKPV